MKPDELTVRQKEALEVFKCLTRDLGGPPSSVDVADTMGCDRREAYTFLSALERKGYLKRRARKGHGFTLA